MISSAAGKFFRNGYRNTCYFTSTEVLVMVIDCHYHSVNELLYADSTTHSAFFLN